MPGDIDFAKYAGGGTIDFSQYTQPAQIAEEKPSTWQRLTAGYNPDVEQFAERHPVAGPALRFLDAAGGAAMALPGATVSSVLHPWETAKSAGQSLAEWRKPETWKGALSVLPEALGQGVGSVAAGEAAGAVTPSRATVAKALRTETGELKPPVNIAARAAGIAGGHALGIPGAGEIGGYFLAPKIADWAIPERAGAEEARFNQRVARGVEAAKVREAVKGKTAPPPIAKPAPAAASAEMPSVMVAPEPSPTPAGVREGSAFSVPREQIPSMIQAGSAGAGEAFRSTGGKLVYEPRGAGISGVKERVAIPNVEETAPRLTTQSFGPDTHQVTTEVGGQHVGHVMYSMDPERVATVDSSLMASEFENKGLGKQMYDRALQDAAGRGAREFRSGSNPEPGARHIWETYLSEKYPVEKYDHGFRIELEPMGAGK